MQRQELLRQLDKDVESLKGAVEDVSRRLRKFEEEGKQFKNEEKQKIPKWAKYLFHCECLTTGKWYPVRNWDGQEFDTDCTHGEGKFRACELNKWEFYYSDNPPEEELKPNGLPVGEYYISIDDGWVEYRYRVKLLYGCSLSIDDIAQRIYKALNVKYNSADGVIRPE